MASKLNEDCLLEIFRFLTPVEWVQISEVCNSWKRVVSLLWKKNKTIWLSDNDDYKQTNPCSKRISANNARKALFYAAPFVEDLTTSIGVKNPTQYCVSIGSFKYKVLDGNENDLKVIFKLLANRATRLTAIDMDEVAEYVFPGIETFITLFKQNPIKKVLVDDYSLKTICENHLTNDIEELCWTVGKKDCCPLVTPYKFLQYLPNLRKLTMRDFRSEPQSISLHDEFESIFKLSKLEILELEYLKYTFDYSKEIFVDKLVSSLTKLREVYIDHVLTTGIILKLMAIPHLKSLKVRPEPSFCPTDIPENGNLSKFHVFFDDINVPTTSTCKAIIKMLKKMPNLQSFHIRITCSSAVENPDIIFQLIIFLASKYQKLIISCLTWVRGIVYKLKLEQKSAFLGRQKEMLHLSFQSPYSQTLLKRLKEHFGEKVSYF